MLLASNNFKSLDEQQQKLRRLQQQQERLMIALVRMNISFLVRLVTSITVVRSL
jgi:hypothetical protein